MARIQLKSIAYFSIVYVDPRPACIVVVSEVIGSQPTSRIFSLQ